MTGALRRCGFGAAVASIILATTMLSPALAAESPPGRWQSKSQLFFDAGTQRLVRRTVRVWDAQPELGLEFTWQPQSTNNDATPDPDGTVNGGGLLTWRIRGTAPYDRSGVYSEYRGEMRDGRPHGRGALTVQTGLSYEGEWQAGIMQGHGAIKYPNGDEYQGDFAAGLPDGQGRYAGADGSILEGLFDKGEPRHTRRIDDGLRLAQAAPRITLKAYTDRQRNQQFVKGDEIFRSFVYDQETTPDAIKIRLTSKELMDAWKGNAPIPEHFKLFEAPEQFAPALLVVEVINEGAQAIQFVGGYLDVAESTTDRQPYVTYEPLFGECISRNDIGVFKAETDVELVNEGWGEVRDAKATYGFGRAAGADTPFVGDVGSFETKGKLSVLDGLRRSGVDVEKVQRGGFKCRSQAQLPACTTQLLATGIMGRLASSIVRRNDKLLVRAAGRLDYSWLDASGATRARQSPFAVEMPVLTFDTGQASECGASPETERDLKPLKFTLDKKNYRIPLGYRGSLAPRQNRRFALTLSAEKSSQHYFKIVLELADGRTITTPKYDLLYFLPNVPPPADTPDDPNQQPGRN
jgi:hypothetical protein